MRTVEQQRDALLEEVAALEAEVKAAAREWGSDDKGEAKDPGTAFDTMISGLMAGLFTGMVGTLLVAGVIALTVSDPKPLEGQLGDLEYEAHGAVMASTEPDLLGAGLHVRVDPEGDRCRFSVELDGGTQVDGTTSCETLTVDDCAHAGGGCLETGLKLEGLTTDGFAKIHELSGALELEWTEGERTRRIDAILVRDRRAP